MTLPSGCHTLHEGLPVPSEVFCRNGALGFAVPRHDFDGACDVHGVSSTILKLLLSPGRPQCAALG